VHAYKKCNSDTMDAASIYRYIAIRDVRGTISSCSSIARVRSTHACRHARRMVRIEEILGPLI